VTPDLLNRFERALEAFGLVLSPGGIVADGEIHRLDDAHHHRRRNQAGWYVLRELPSGLAVGWYGSWWRDRGRKRWSSRHQKKFTKADRQAIHEQNAKIAAHRLRRHQEGAQLAARMLEAAKLCTWHSYLERKCVQSYGLHVLDDDVARSFDLSDYVGDLLLIPGQ
jgi:hypothetical protein